MLLPGELGAKLNTCRPLSPPTGKRTRPDGCSKTQIIKNSLQTGRWPIGLLPPTSTGRPASRGEGAGGSRPTVGRGGRPVVSSPDSPCRRPDKGNCTCRGESGGS